MDQTDQTDQTDHRKMYTDEFKREAVRLANKRGNIAATARDLGIPDNVLHRWKRRLEDAKDAEAVFPGQGVTF